MIKPRPCNYAAVLLTTKLFNRITVIIRLYILVDLEIHYLPPYECTVWNYQQATIDLIDRAINEFIWENAFRNVEIDNQVSIFNGEFYRIFLIILYLMKTITCDNGDPSWINKRIK